MILIIQSLMLNPYKKRLYCTLLSLKAVLCRMAFFLRDKKTDRNGQVFLTFFSKQEENPLFSKILCLKALISPVKGFLEFRNIKIWAILIDKIELSIADPPEHKSRESLGILLFGSDQEFHRRQSSKIHMTFETRFIHFLASSNQFLNCSK